MAGTLHTDEYRTVIRALAEARRELGLSQAALARRIGRPPSFVAKVELCERRLDIVEFSVIASALSCDPASFLKKHLPKIPAEIPC